MRLIIVLLLCGTAHAEPRWYEQFYAYTGYRSVAGVERASSRSSAIGYRFERATWGLDLAVLDVQRGHDEGVHELARVTAYTTILPGLWLGGGGSYGLVRGWTDAALPARAGAGFAIDAVAGYDLPSESILRVFVQLAVTVPVFAALDRYGGEDSDVHVVAAELAVGVRL